MFPLAKSIFYFCVANYLKVNWEPLNTLWPLRVNDCRLWFSITVFGSNISIMITYSVELLLVGLDAARLLLMMLD